MKISIFKNTLEIVLNNFQSFLDKRDFSQITSHIFFKTIDNKLLLRATDYEIGIQAHIDIFKIEEEGQGTVSGKQILEIIKRLKDDKEIFLIADHENLTIKQGKSQFKLPMFNSDEFPNFPVYNTDTKIQIPSHQFIEAIKKINPAVGTNNPKIELNGALLDIKEYMINFVATDTRRLALMKYETQSINTLSIIIPKKALNEIQKLCADDFEIYHNENQLIIQTGIYTFSTKLTNGRFPDYERIIPKSFTHILELPKNDFVSAIRIINSVSQEIKMTFKANEILFESMSSENSQGSTQCEIQTNFENEFSIGINSKNLLDFLAQVHDETFTLCLNESNNPFMVKSENFSTIIMPIVL
ncbi:DNA polymerase III subunit beta [Helicobacter kayseriensis]|uniref:DNA polymerase III subunit beta n=1 Tax=Helicobacter kayseriensis TaxID=2905877 RepID=UPI001E39D203|nr:DNA polymerase III subunit beta [Helicobacter kayseriensis]MCE3047147.1 DNA polymerase III subunit beta [Helicobacter kayseriensis]MCE3048518.1 DNA polymerase III subunit beta [Helicobacter kayseriensis]